MPKKTEEAMPETPVTPEENGTPRANNHTPLNYGISTRLIDLITEATPNDFPTTEKFATENDAKDWVRLHGIPDVEYYIFSFKVRTKPVVKRTRSILES